MTADPRARSNPICDQAVLLEARVKDSFFPFPQKKKKPWSQVSSKHVLGEEGLAHNWMRHVCIVFFLIGEATSQKPIYPELYRPLSVGDAQTGKPVRQPRLFTPPRLPSLSPTPLPFSLFPFRRLPASPPPTLHEHSITPASSITKTGSSSASLPLPASFVLMWNRELPSLSSVGPYSYNSHLCIFFSKEHGSILGEAKNREDIWW